MNIEWAYLRSSGNLRVPTIQTGSAFIIGYDETLYQQLQAPSQG